jgi:hypothetical protein
MRRDHGRGQRKAGGYYGCIAATKGACENKLLVRPDVGREDHPGHSQRLSSPDAIDYTFRRVEEAIGKLYAHIPETPGSRRLS